MAAFKLLWARHDPGAMGMDMDSGDDDMNVGTIDVLWFPKLYWIFVGAVIAALTFFNLLEHLLLRQRLAAASRPQYPPARPRNILPKSYATLTAVAREISNASGPSFRLGSTNFLPPTIGKLSLVLGHTVLVLVLCFYALRPSRFSDFENTAYRAGFVSLGQLPLIFLLAGKNNIIGWLTGSSYERLNWLHRWVSRTILLTVTLHGAFWFRSWAPYNYIGESLRENQTAQRGFIAWIILIWIVFSSFAPIRRWSYEVFVLQHLVSMLAFMVMLFLHLPSSDYGWLYAPIAVYLFDRLVRASYAAYINLAIFHPRQNNTGAISGLWSSRAELTALTHGVTKVTIRDPPLTWKAGQHAFISCHSIVPLQSHPFTISSLPSDNKLEFFVKARKGATRRLLKHATNSLDLSGAEGQAPSTVAVAIEGPYGRIRPLQQFDSVILVAGSTGATFTMPLLRDLVLRWKTASCCATKGNIWTTPVGSVTRHVRFNWVVKSQDQLLWFAKELSDVIEDMKALQKEGRSNISLEIHAYVTCDETLTADFAEKPPVSRPQGMTRVMSIASSDASINEKKKDASDTIYVREVDSRLESGSDTSLPERRPQQALKTCQPDGTCCCRTSITSSSEAAEVVCTCNGCSHDDSSLSASSSAVQVPQRPRLHPDIVLRSGRPTPRHLLLPVLEQAHGETAVVVCGPLALNEEVRRATVSLSDERAVHKGTGAQGIYYHGEGFGY